MVDTAEHHAPPPRANPALLGHEVAERALRCLFRSGRMPHAVLLTGPRGIGKATLAYRFARFVLSQTPRGPDAGWSPCEDGGLFVPDDHPIFRRVASGGHADLLTVQRAYDPRRRRVRSEIVVEEAREITAFLRLTAAEGGWRVVIVDGADEMNRSAANALLKILEEPPHHALLLLVTHSPGRLLPTIRSRCRRFSIGPLPHPIVSHLLGIYRPALSGGESDILTALADGSIGRALEFAEAGGIELYQTVLKLLSQEQGANPVELHALTDRFARGDADNVYRVLGELLGYLLGEIAIGATDPYANRRSCPVSEPMLHRLSVRAPASRWAELREQITTLFARGEALNLDRKQIILSTFFSIERTVR